MTGNHRDDDGDGRADRGRVIPPHLLDRQTELFRERGAGLRVDDADLTRQAERVHPGLPPGTHPANVIRLPEEYEAEQWDRDAVGPPSLAQARADLAARIDDPRAPDGPEAAGAYDDGDGGRPEDGGAW